ncbi:MAG: PAS domain S-box protein [Desulfobacterales bacterium]|nr:PAS domain S-box protein [Desulfobacterales bacterium]
MAENKSKETLMKKIQEPKKKKELIIENKKLWEFALNGANLGTWTYNARTEQLQMDQRAVEIYRSKPTTMDEWLSIIHPDDFHSVKDENDAFMNDIHDERTFEYEYRVITDSGKVAWLLERGRKIELEKDGKPFRTAGTICDITKKKEAERLQKEETERYNLAVNATRDGIWDWNIKTNIIECTDRCREIIEYLDSDKLGYLMDSDLWENHIFLDDYKRISKALKDHLEKGTVYNTNFRYRTHNTEPYRWINSRGQAIFNEKGEPVRMVGCFRDISDLKTTQIALEQSEQRFRNFLNNMADVAYEIDSSGKITYINKAAENLFNLPIEQIRGMSFFPLVASECRQFAIDSHQQTLKGINREEYEVTVGRGKIAQFINEPLRNKDGKVIGAFGIARDISDRKKIEEELKEAQKDLEHRVEIRTKELKSALDEMIKKENEVEKHKKSLKKINGRLLESNQALSALARNIDEEKNTIESNIQQIINAKIMPIICELRNREDCKKWHADLGIIANHLSGLVPGSENQQNINNSLSNQEMKISILIKDGLTSEQIAENLYISLHTVKTHRKNIRNKLKIKNEKINLVSYLKTAIKTK